MNHNQYRAPFLKRLANDLIIDVHPVYADKLFCWMDGGPPPFSVCTYGTVLMFFFTKWLECRHFMIFFKKDTTSVNDYSN